MRQQFDLLPAMNTGHDGSLSTGHANSPRDMLNRLETLVLMGMDIPWRRCASRLRPGLISWCIWEGSGMVPGGCCRLMKSWE